MLKSKTALLSALLMGGVLMGGCSASAQDSTASTTTATSSSPCTEACLALTVTNSSGDLANQQGGAIVYFALSSTTISVVTVPGGEAQYQPVNALMPNVEVYAQIGATTYLPVPNNTYYAMSLLSVYASVGGAGNGTCVVNNPNPAGAYRWSSYQGGWLRNNAEESVTVDCN